MSRFLLLIAFYIGIGIVVSSIATLVEEPRTTLGQNTADFVWRIGIWPLYVVFISGKLLVTLPKGYVKFLLNVKKKRVTKKDITA